MSYTFRMAWRGHHRLLEPGSRAPDFRLELLGGGVTTLAELLAGGPVLLAFFKIGCPVCQMTFPFLERIHAAGTLRRKQAIVASESMGAIAFAQTSRDALASIAPG